MKRFTLWANYKKGRTRIDRLKGLQGQKDFQMAEPKPFWLDSNTIMSISNGDVMLELDVVTLRNSGFQLLYTPNVERELFEGNIFRGKAVPFEKIARTRFAINRLGAQLDDSVNRGRTLELVELGFDIKSRKMESDVVVLSEVASSAEARGVADPKIFTNDEGVFKRASTWGIEPFTRSTPPPPPQPKTLAWQPEPPKMGEPWQPENVFTATTAGEFMGSFAGLNAIQMKILSEASMQDGAAEAWDDWKVNRRSLKAQLKSNPGLGYSVTFWFEFVPRFDINFPDKWNYLSMETRLTKKQQTLPAQSLWESSGRAGSMLQHIDVWIPPVYPAVSPKPLVQTGPAGPGRSCSPQMDSVEVDVYQDLDKSRAKSIGEIARDTGLPEGDVGVALTKLNGKNMAAYWNKGEASGWIRTQ